MRWHEIFGIAFAILFSAWATEARAQTSYGIGRLATAAEIAGWNIDIGRDGSNLPKGSGSVSHEREVFAQQCASCHGDKGEGGLGDRLVGGQDTIGTPKPIRTVGSYWPYAPTLFDYIRRAMPQNAPQSLSEEDVYAVSAYILNLNGLVGANATLDAKSLAAVKMPNRDRFLGDARPDVKSERIVMSEFRAVARDLLKRRAELAGRACVNPREENSMGPSMATDRFANSMSSALRHPGVIALIVAALTIAAMLIVDHGPWNRAKTQPAHVAMYHTTGEAAHAAGAKVLPTQPKSPVEPERPGPKTSPTVNPVTP